MGIALLLLGGLLVMLTTDETLYLLRRAGNTMLKMPGGGVALNLSAVAMDAVDDPRLAYGYTPVVVNRVPPSARDISLMDLVYGWLALIPNEKYVLRKIVAHRMLWDPDRCRSVWSYRKLGSKLHTSHQAVKNWDEQGVELIRKLVINKKSVMEKIDVYMTEFLGAYNGYIESAAPAPAPFTNHQVLMSLR